MEFDFNDLIQNSSVFLMPFLIFIVIFIVSFIIRKFIFGRLLVWANKSSSRIGGVIITATKGPSVIWCLMAALYFSLEFSCLSESAVQIAEKVLFVLGALSVTLAAVKISDNFIKVYSARIDSALPVTSLTQNLGRIIIFGVGILILLNSLGVSVTPILATLGVGGLAVALALQDTLSNLFSGFHIIMARQIKVGDYIRLESGEEGYIIDINWRSTKIKMLPNNVVLIPNEKLARSIVINYYLPDKELAVLLDLSVHYKSDLVKVEKVTCEVGREVMEEVPGGVAHFEPFIRFHSFKDSGIGFTVILRAKEYVDQYLIKHEFIKRLHKRYAKEGIVVPYPIWAVNYAQEKGE